MAVFVGVSVGGTVFVEVGVRVRVGVFVGVWVAVFVGVRVGGTVFVEVGVFVGVWVAVFVGVLVSVAVPVTVGVAVFVAVGVFVGVGVAVGVAVGMRIATVMVLLPETESSNNGDVWTVPLRSTRAVAVVTPAFTLIGHPIEGKAWVVSEGAAKPDATEIGFARSGVPSALGQKKVMAIVSASQAIVVGGLLLVFDNVSVYVSVDPFATNPVGV